MLFDLIIGSPFFPTKVHNEIFHCAREDVIDQLTGFIAGEVAGGGHARIIANRSMPYRRAAKMGGYSEKTRSFPLRSHLGASLIIAQKRRAFSENGKLRAFN